MAALAALLQLPMAQALDITVHQDFSRTKGAWIDAQGGTLEAAVDNMLKKAEDKLIRWQERKFDKPKAEPIFFT